MNKLLIFLIIIIHLLKSFVDLSLIKCPEKCKCEYQSFVNTNENIKTPNESLKSIICKDFLSFSELDFKIINDSKIIEEVETLDLEPAIPILLDSLLDLRNVKITKQVILRNLKGFLYNSDPFKNTEISLDGKSQLELRLFNSEFEFYESYSNKLDSKCDMESFGNIDTILTKFSKLWLNDNVKYSTSLCPLVFRNTHIDLVLAHFLNSTNKFNFKKNNTTKWSTYNINSNINYLYLFNVKLDKLDSSFLNSQVFGKVKRLHIFGNLNEIEDKLFDNIKSLKSIILELFNFEKFIKKSKYNQWLDSFMEYGNPVLLNMNDRETLYEFPDNDFCFFKNFPIKNVFPILKTKENLKCSCSLMWILRNSRNFSVSLSQFNQLLTSSVKNCLTLEQQKFDKIIKECKYEEKIKRCDDENSSNATRLAITVKTIKPGHTKNKILNNTTLISRSTKKFNLNDQNVINLKTTKEISTFQTAKKARSENIDSTLSTISMVMGGLGFVTISVILIVIMFFFK